MKHNAAKATRLAILVLICAAAVAGMYGCEDESPYLNSCPRITHVSSLGWADDGLHVAVWVQDLEEDPVDLGIETDSGAEVVVVYGHGAIGLSSQEDNKGAPHEIVLADDAVKTAKEVTLTPTDVDGCEGASSSLSIPAR